ncbi:methyltransferase domain-containing protein [candidate division KSB1 bacterium]|nr:methyltransferase domain-containing protein [candidate division KSB1 bacterium]
MSDSSQMIMQQVNKFYENHPFPGFDLRKYSYRDDLKRKASWFGHLIDDQIPYDSHILDAGCGTGQLATFLAAKGRTVTGIDYSQHSLDKAQQLADRMGIDTVRFQRMNILDLDLPDNQFDLVLSMGVLHHTSDPIGGFRQLVRVTRPGGFLFIGLYHPIGRFPVNTRRCIRRHFPHDNIEQAAVTRQLVGDIADVEKTESWLADQYHHPHESTHSVGEVLHWFRDSGIEYVNSLPPIEWFRQTRKNTKLFKTPPVAEWRRRAPARWWVEFKWLFTLRDNGGYFTLIGRKQ